MEYKTVIRSSVYEDKASERLDEKVNELLLDGWVLLGDVSITISTVGKPNTNTSTITAHSGMETVYCVAQALTKTT